MKQFLLLVTLFVVTTTSQGKSHMDKKGPVVIEVETNHKTVQEALQATKTILLTHKFIVQDGLQEASFTAKRTTGAEADYYIADVSVKRSGETNTITITFIKVGTGLLKLSKVADKVKAELEKQYLNQ